MSAAIAHRLALRTTVVVASLLAGVLLGTGVWLWFHYLPSGMSPEWDPVIPFLKGRMRVRLVHGWASQALLLDALVILGLLLGRRAMRRQWPKGLWLLAIALLGSFTGFLLPWDQLSLFGVSVGTDIEGLSVFWSDDVRFVIVDGVEVSTATIQRWAVVHAVVLPVLALLVPAGVLAVRRRRPRRALDPACSTTTSRT